MDGAYGMGGKKYTIFVGKPDRKTTLRISWCEWDDNIKMVL